ncbi:MAG: sodium:calcium antiporter [Candidatus Hydrothermarchaeota archaeon]|nr:sodium:calcium antiporter [Candidatus Hydrothermarchaeota archaeon]
MIEIITFILGIALIVWATERFVEGMIGSALILGVSTFALGVVFGGFDAENLGTGIAAGLKDLPGISMGTIIGSSMFLLGAAVGITGFLVPLEVRVPKKYIYLTLISPLPLLALMLDGTLSRTDGLALLLISLPLIAYIVRDSKNHAFMEEDEEFEEVLEERAEKPSWYFPALMLFGLALIIVGATLLVRGANGIIQSFGISDTLLGMVFVAAAVSFEEVVRMVVPAYKGSPEISMGNILGTVLFFVLFNAGLIALISPLRIESSVIAFHFPAMMLVLAVTSIFMLRGRIARIEGTSLMALYGIYLILNYL